MNRRTSLLFALFTNILLFGFVELLLADDEPSAKKNEPLATFQIPKNGDGIVLPVTVGKKEYLFSLDTGASLNVIDKSLKNELGNYPSTEKVLTAKEVIDVESYDSPPLRLGNVNLQTTGKVLCQDLNKIRMVDGREIYGVLSMDSMRHMIVQIDFDRGELNLFSPETKPETEWGESFEIIPYLNKCQGIHIIFDKVPYFFLIDTGCSGISIDERLFQQLYSKRQIGILEKALFSTCEGDMELKDLNLNRIVLRSFEHNNVICVQGNLNILGLSYLSRYQVTFDFPHNAMYLKKGKRYQEVEHDNMSGLHILQEDKKAVVKIVDADSPAENAGILPEDIILRVDDQDVSKISMFELRNLFKAGDGKKFRLTISRDDKEMEKSLVLKEKIPQWAEPAKE